MYQSGSAVTLGEVPYSLCSGVLRWVTLTPSQRRFAVANKPEYLDRLKRHIERTQHCVAYFLRTETVHECVDGRTVWLGDVEVFGLIGHPAATSCFAWGHRGHSSSDHDALLVVVVAVPPVASVRNAVRLQLIHDLTHTTR